MNVLFMNVYRDSLFNLVNSYTKIVLPSTDLSEFIIFLNDRGLHGEGGLNLGPFDPKLNALTT